MIKPTSPWQCFQVLLLCVLLTLLFSTTLSAQTDPSETEIDSSITYPYTVYHFPAPMDAPDFPFTLVTVDRSTPKWAKMLYEVNPNIKKIRQIHTKWRQQNWEVKNAHTRNFKKLSGYLAQQEYVNEEGFIEIPTMEAVQQESKQIKYPGRLS